MRQLNNQIVLLVTGLAIGASGIILTIVVPVIWLRQVDGQVLTRWSLIGQAVAPIGVLYAGLALLGIIATLIVQGRELSHQREELTVALDEQRRSSEIALRQLHTDVIHMSIQDSELREVWPEFAPGVPETRKDHYCNLILNLQKVAFEAGTIEEAELRNVLDHLMRSADMYAFWSKVRAPRVEITGGDPGEDFFTAMVDRAHEAASPPSSPSSSPSSPQPSPPSSSEQVRRRRVLPFLKL